ncbi:hypothetical protein TYRP_022953 [Tyrophagus putrescentiae]|nr:hypothetical protein TYRP_022953 [Tyrophagus putrescentiae]
MIYKKDAEKRHREEQKKRAEEERKRKKEEEKDKTRQRNTNRGNRHGVYVNQAEPSGVRYSRQKVGVPETAVANIWPTSSPTSVEIAHSSPSPLPAEMMARVKCRKGGSRAKPKQKPRRVQRFDHPPVRRSPVATPARTSPAPTADYSPPSDCDRSYLSLEFEQQGRSCSRRWRRAGQTPAPPADHQVLCSRAQPPSGWFSSVCLDRSGAESR